MKMIGLGVAWGFTTNSAMLAKKSQWTVESKSLFLSCNQCFCVVFYMHICFDKINVLLSLRIVIYFNTKSYVIKIVRDMTSHFGKRGSKRGKI